MAAAPRRIDAALSRAALAVRRAATRPLTLIVAGPGYGKTRAIADAFGAAEIVRIGRDADSLHEVARDLARACAPQAALAYAGCARRARAAADPGDVYAAWLADRVAGREEPIALDGLDAALALPGVAAFLVALVARSAGRARWVYVLRDADALPVATWLAEGTAETPIDETVLSLRGDEVARYAEQRGIERAALMGIEPRLATVALACDLLRGGAPSREIGRHAGALARLVGHAFADADAAERRILALGARLDRLDDDLLDAAPVRGARSVLAGLRARLPSAFDDEGLAPWFRDAVGARIDGDPRYEQATAQAVEVLERAGRPFDALRLALRYDDAATAGTIVVRHLERFLAADAPPSAVAALARLELTWDDTPLRAMQGILAADRGDHDGADGHYRAAIAGARGPLRSTIVHRYGLELLRRRRTGAAELLEAHLDSAGDGEATLTPLRATLATAYALAGRHDEARAAMVRALAGAAAIEDRTVLARIAHQRAFVALRRGDALEAETAAERAIALAAESGAHGVAAGAYTILYELARAGGDAAAALSAREAAAREAALGAFDLLDIVSDDEPGSPGGPAAS